MRGNIPSLLASGTTTGNMIKIQLGVSTAEIPLKLAFRSRNDSF